MTTQVTGNYVVGSAQTLTFTDPTGAVYTLVGSPSTTDPTFTDDGSITVSSSATYTTVAALTDNANGLINQSLIEIAQTASLSVTTTGAGSSAYGYESGTVGAAAVENDGTLSVSSVAAAYGVALNGLNYGSGPDFTNSGQLTVSGYTAMAVTAGLRADFVNSGTLQANGVSEADGFVLGGQFWSNSAVVNSGTITATASAGVSFGIRIGGGGYLPGQYLPVTNSGTITAQHAIYEMAGAYSIHLANSGTLNGDIVVQDGSSVYPTAPGSVILNTGAINGTIHFNGLADDYYDGRGGTQTGGIFLGAGTDTAYLGNDGETVTGGSGAGAIIGGTGADNITGGSGVDLIEGGGGNDILTGGTGADTYLFTGASGAATITNFSAAKGDKIDLSALGTFFSLSDVQANAVQSGSDTVITVGSGTLTLQGILPSDLVASDFTFSGASYSPVTVSGPFNTITGVHVYSGSNGGAGAYALATSQSAMTLDAYILVQDSAAGDIVTGIVGGTLNGSATIDAGASLVVDETGSGSTAYGVQGSYATNNGAISASASSQATGVLLTPGFGAALINGGSITVTSPVAAYGVQYVGPSSGSSSVTIGNAGVITATSTGASYGIEYGAAASTSTVSVTNTGVITAQNAIVAFQTTPGQTPMLSLYNSGTINGAIDVGYGPSTIDTYTGGSYDHSIVNYGTINGAIHLSETGSDYYFGPSGTLHGGIYLAGGANTIYLGNDGETVYAGYGGTATIMGGTGADTITGGAGNDTINGGGGNDILTGGGGVNTFVFTVASGQTVVTNFNLSNGDKIDLKAFDQFFSLADVLAASTQVNADTVISLGGSATITLQNVHKADLTASDFVVTTEILVGAGTTTIGPTANMSVSSGFLSTPIAYFTQPSGGTLINQGSMSLTGTSLVTGVSTSGEPDASATFVNEGGFSVSGLGATGVSFATTQNSGTFTVTGTSGSYQATGVTGGLINSGSLTVQGPGLAYGVSESEGGAFQNLAGAVISVSSSASGAVGAMVTYGSDFENAGQITVSGATSAWGLNYNVYGVGNDSIDNSGTIIASGATTIGILIGSSAGAPSVTLQNSGTITAQVSVRDYATPLDMTNSGTLDGAIQLANYADTVVNTGTITGPVNLGNASGNTLDSHLGTINGVVTVGTGSNTIILGAENNTVAISTGTNVVDGGGGTNTVSYASAASGVHVSLALQGQAQNIGVGTDTLTHFQALIGSAYSDTLEGGGSASSTLTGGLGADTFIDRPGDGAVTITDFSDAQGDKIDLSNFYKFTTLAQVLALASQSNADTVINFGGGSSVTLQNVTLANLTASDFVFTTAPILVGATAVTTDLALNLSAASGPLVQFTASGGELINNGTLTLTTSSTPAIQASGAAASISLLNNGTITAQVAIDFGGVSANITNTGTINGAINLGNGNLDSHSGTINGMLTLGSGSDTVTLGAENNTVALGAGTHVVDGGGGTNTVSYAGAASGVHVSLALQGQAQNTGGGGTDTLTNFQALVGSSYNDTLEGGGSASTTLTGGLGADTFVYQPGDGAVTITDFSHAQGDVIDLSHLGYLFNLSELNGTYSPYALYGTPAARQVGLDTVITLGAGSLRLVGVSLLSLTAADFKFSAGPPVGPAAGGTPQTGSAAGGTLTGTSGADWLLGLSGNDTLHGGPGSDYLDGGPGLNTATYDGVFRQYTVGVQSGVGGVTGGPEGGTDDLVNIQRVQFVDGYLATSPTDTAGQVYRVYEATLGRAPDPEGLANWVHALNSGTSLQTVVNGFVGSQEFQADYGSLSDAAFVTLLYNNVLHRAPDAAGLNNWLTALSSGQTRAQVVTGFTESGEDIADLAAPVSKGLWIQDDAAAEAARLYDTVFGRLPDASGLINWTHSLEGGMTLQTAAADFVASQEFQSKYGSLDNNSFLTLLYQNVLHRAPDTAGMNNWLATLASGVSRAQVVLDFSESQEHVADTAPHIDNGIWLAS
jgi:Ca2+-binding RTX toxin-like protein